MDRLFYTIGSLSGFLDVALGAFAAHALKGRLDADLLVSFEMLAAMGFDATTDTAAPASAIVTGSISTGFDWVRASV
jgi:uncharacterized membrane protein YgdD (TMEM256/DUF423 family)